nr:efflux RND transporter permease subunit [Ruegeria sp. Ofav3-42]
MSRVFILKTTFARLLLIILVVGGVMSAIGMVKEAQPDLNIASAIVTTEWGEADGQTIEQQVTLKLEKHLKDIPGVKKLLSGSFQGFSVISVEFRANVSPEEAMTNLRAKLAEAKSELPAAAKEPKLKQTRVSDSPIFSIRLTGDAGLEELSKTAEDLKKELGRIQGVNEAKVIGKRDDIVAIRLIGARLQSLGISATQVAHALEQNNLNMPWGKFDGEQLGSIFRFQGRFDSLDQIRDLPITRADSGRVIRLSEVAEVRRTLAEERTRTSFSIDDGPFKTAIELSLTKQPGADAINVITQAKELLADRRARETWPEGIEYYVVTDNSVTINTNLTNVFNNGWQAMLAVFVILFFSLTWREALVAGLAIPITFAGTLIVLALFGFTLNQMVIIGMVIALGLLVDVFILMMEGMHDAMFVKGKKFSDAALETIRTYAIPALTGTLTTVFAMAPLLGIEGTAGKFIRILPSTAIVALLMALLVALVLAVPLSRYVLPKPGTVVKKTAIDRISEKLSESLDSLLERFFVRNRLTAIAWTAVAGAVFTASLMAFSTLPSELLGRSDGQDMGVLIELEPDTSLETAQMCADAAGDVLAAQPFFKSVTKYVGEKSPFSTPALSDQLSSTKDLSYVGFTGTFLPRKDREKIAYEYEDDIRSALGSAMTSCPGGRLNLTMPAGDASPESPVQIVLSGPDIDRLRDMSMDVQSKLKEIQGTRNVRDNLGLVALDIEAKPKMEVLNFYGLPAEELAKQVRFMLNTDDVGKYVLGGIREDIDIRMGYAWPSREGQLGGPTIPGEPQLLNVITSNGNSVPLAELVDVELKESALNILHWNGERAITVLSDVSGKTASQVLDDLLPELDKLSAQWGQDYGYTIAGEAADSAEVFGSAGVMLLVALFLVAALLVLQFDNFIQPLIIMATIPLALTGTFLGFYILQLPFSFMAMVGVIALIGIVVNDSIVMIDTMNKHARSGLSVRAAAARGGSDRLRPIITTSLTTIVGMIPLTFSSPLWMPLGVTIISGLIFSTVLALLIVPCLYRIFTHEGLHAEG